MTAAGNWRDSLLKALLPVAAVMAYLFWRGGGSLPSSAGFWGILALIIAPEVAATVASSYLHQTGRHNAARWCGIGGAVWLFGGLLLLVMHNNARTFTDAERADLVSVDEGGERRLMHPALGFSFRHPGPGFVSNGSPPSKPGTQFYAFTDREQGVTLGIGLFKGDGDSPTSLRKLLELLGRETTSLSAPPKTPARVVELETAADMPPRGSLHVALGDGRHYRVRGQGWRSATGSSFAILISVTSRTPDAGDDILASFRPPATER